MIARVLREREDVKLAFILTALSTVGLGLVLVEDATKIGPIGYGPSVAMFAFVATLIALGGIGPWIVWTRRGDAMTVRCQPGEVHVGNAMIAARDVTAVSVAEGARGFSVAVVASGKTTFVEVERSEDAARIAEALGGERGAVPLRRGSRALAFPQLFASIWNLVASPLYFAAAIDLSIFNVLSGYGKPFFGFGGVIGVTFSMALLAARRLIPSQNVAVGRGVWDMHVALHTTAKKSDALSAPLSARAGPLARGEEAVGAWLARLDAYPIDDHAYRGDAMKKDVLWSTLGDADAPVDARMAAARVLSRRYGEANGELVRVVVEPDVRVRVEAVLEEHEDAERRIEMLGPLFRAR